MPTFSLRQRLKIALGGFVSFTGLIILTCVILALTNTANLAPLLQGATFIFITALVGALDIACGLLLLFSNKEIVVSFASHEKKANNNTD